MISKSESNMIHPNQSSKTQQFLNTFCRSRITRRFPNVVCSQIIQTQGIRSDRQSKCQKIKLVPSVQQAQTKKLQSLNELKTISSEVCIRKQCQQQMICENIQGQVHNNDESLQSKRMSNSLQLSNESYNSQKVQKMKKRTSQHQSPYEQNRKSYRKGQRNKGTAAFIPYRKTQDHFEVKIVSILNKLLNGKYCEKDLVRLTDHKLQRKQYMNRYIVSGFKAIQQLVIQSSLYDVIILQRQIKIIKKIKEFILNIAELIEIQLDNGDQYDQGDEEDNIFDEKLIFVPLVRKIYRILRQNDENSNKQQLQRQAVQYCETFMSKNILGFQSVVQLLRKINSIQDLQIQH